MHMSLRALSAASLGFGLIAGLAGCSISTAPAAPTPVVVQAAPPAASGTFVAPGATVVVPPSRY